MLLIEDYTDLLSLEEKEILEKKYLSFVNNDEPKKYKNSENYYVREHISKDNPEFQTIIYKINDRIEKEVKNHNTNLDCFWINKVTNNTNKNDTFHRDLADITLVMYLNDNFTGGEYEYFIPDSSNKEKIKPKKYLTIISSRDIQHRVTPVLEGERFSIVFFYVFTKKTNKTLI